MSVTVNGINKISVIETLETNTDSSSTANSIITHSEFDETYTLNNGTTPPVTKSAFFVQALSGDTATVDLMSLTGVNGATVVGDGLKVQFLRVKNLGAATLSLTFGALTPYELSGADWKQTLQQGQIFTYYGNDATPDIGGGAKHIDLSGTGVETSEWTVVMG